MKERPILFSGEMVRAILEGRKSVTRRVIKPQPVLANDGLWDYWKGGEWQGAVDPGDGRFNFIQCCPYGMPGDRLWVREAWGSGDRFIYEGEQDPPRIVVYRADGAAMNYAHDDDGYFIEAQDWNLNLVKWRPSIHMPRWASRITLEVVDVRVERVQEISDEDVLAEGVSASQAVGVVVPGSDITYPSLMFRDLWNSINAGRGFGWDADPWVWCVEFKRVEAAHD